MRTIKYTVKYEDLISRIPGLFAYIEENELGEMVLHKATESIDGCYGKIVENIKLPNIGVIKVQEIIDDEVVTHSILRGNNVYSYKTLINYYYKYKDVLGQNNKFIQFMDNGIGKVKVTGVNFDEAPACPEYVYLSTVDYLYNEMIKLQKKCNFYEIRQNVDGFDGDMCCLCERFHNMGGDNFINFLESKLNEANVRANTYFNYAVKEEDNSRNILKLRTNFNVNLISSINDMGVVTPYIEEYEFGKLYKEYDRIACLENGVWETYTVQNDTTGNWNEDLWRLEFPYQDVINNDQEITDETNLYSQFLNGNTEITLTGYCNSHLKSLRRTQDYLNVFDSVERPTVGTDWLFYYRKGMVVNYKTLKDELGNILTNSNSYSSVGNYVNDMYAYGDVIKDISFYTDENGIDKIVFEYYLDAHLKAKLKKIDRTDDGQNLYLFDEFELDTESDMGKYHGVKYIEEFVYKHRPNVEDDKRYIDDLIKENKFNDYVSGKLDFGMGNEYDQYNKYEFDISNSTIIYDKNISYMKVGIPTTIAKFEARIFLKRPVQKVNLFRHEYYQGISYTPTKYVNVNIDRGITSAFEKHIKFSEIKTLTDMEEYSNGSFFKLENS